MKQWPPLEDDHFIDPVRVLTIHSRRTLGNKYRCWYCGTWGKTEGDHFYPHSLGGVLKVRCCVPCNREKADLTPLEWLKYIEGLMARCRHTKTGCDHGEYIKGKCEVGCKEYEKFERMHRATLTLWNRLQPVRKQI